MYVSALVGVRQRREFPCRARAFPRASEPRAGNPEYDDLIPSFSVSVSLVGHRDQTLFLLSMRLSTSIRCSTKAIARYSYASSSSRALSTANPQRPYTFHMASSWAGKPVERDTFKKTPFTPTSPIGRWRDKMLTRKAGSSTEIWYPDAGEDFFFVQEVRLVNIYAWQT